MQTAARSPDRVHALDVVRGIAVAAMLLSGQLPRVALPGWMYHAQNPPPTHVYSPWLPGITWVDLVFPLFLFALGAAIPLAMAPRLAAGMRTGAAAAGVLRRAALLALFAIYVRHISPHVVELGARWQDALFALAGLATLFAMLAGCPRHWTPARRRLVRAAGWAGACALMALFRDAQGQGFSPARSDIILLVMANVSLSGGLLYLCTRRRPQWRLAVLALLLALRLGHGTPGWAALAWNASPAPWLAPLAFQQYLFVVVPGMFAGEVLLRAARRRPVAAVPARLEAFLPASCCLVLVALCTAGLYAREQLGLAAAALLPPAAGGAWALRDGPDARARGLRQLYAMGLLLMLLGLAFDPFEGGTQKGVATLSYYLIGAAAGSLLLLAALLLAPDGRPADGLLAGAGKNPMFAYVGLQTLVTPLLDLSGLSLPLAHLNGALAGSLRALLLTVLVCALARLALRRQLAFRL